MALMTNNIILPSAPSPGARMVGCGWAPSEPNYYSLDPLSVICLLDNGLVVEADIGKHTTFNQLYEITMALAKQSPLYSAAHFEGVEFTMLYYTQSGEEKHGLTHETVLSTLEGENFGGPLLGVVKFEKKSSSFDEHSRMASILHCDVEDIQALLQLEDKSDRKEIEVEVFQFRRHASVVSLAAVLDRIHSVKREKTVPHKYLAFLTTVCPLTLPTIPIRMDQELEQLLRSNVRHIELIHLESNGETSSNSCVASPLVIPDMDYLSATVSDLLSKATPLVDPSASSDASSVGLQNSSSLNGFSTSSSGSSSMYNRYNRNDNLLKSSRFVIKVFGCEIYLTEDVLFIEVPEIVSQLTQQLYDRGASVVLRLILCEKADVVNKYNFDKFQHCTDMANDLAHKKQDLEKAEKRQQQQRNKKTVSVSSLDMGERYTFHPSAVMLGDEVEAELKGENYWVTVNSYLTFGDTIVTQVTFPTKKKNEAQWALQEGGGGHRPSTHVQGRTEVPVCSLPRSATLCFIVTISKTEKPSQYDYVKKFWANFCVFDHNELLKCGPNNLHLWEMPQDSIALDQPNLTGTTIDNFRTFQKKHESGVRLVISCMSHKTHKHLYRFENPLSSGLNVQWLSKINKLTHVSLWHLSNIDERPLEEKVWIFKQAVEYYYQGLPDTNIFCGQSLLLWLPQIVKCVDFSDADMVHNLKLILEKCQPAGEHALKTDQCLVLLGFHCQDIEVRKFAVQHLDKKPVSELKNYLLQICECLKFERYLTNDLTEMLLKKSFFDHSFAHALFWNLRVFLFDEHHWLRTCLIIEALFYGIPDYQSLLEKPLTVMEKLKDIGGKLKKLENASVEKQSFILQEFLQANSPVLQHFLCPLCPSKFLSLLQPTECKCMKSKMKPIRLVYHVEESVSALQQQNNNNSLNKQINNNSSNSRLSSSASLVSWNGDSGRGSMSTLVGGGGSSSSSGMCFELMFKVGDDLRQDVLILQMFSCFNSLWLKHDLDLRLLSYKCLAAEVDSGLIEMVQSASTISKIQKWYNEEKKKAFGAVSAAWSKDAIYLWLASDIHNANKPLPEDVVKKAVEEFVFSCAGSCVASYVLGIGDRHNDNIMVHRSGRLFHIDFGHILGRKKQKFGINRERVPLILPASFMYIINRDFESNDQNPSYRENFKSFQNLCIKAFLVLRDNVDMVCNMLYAMKNAGMPELKSLSDVNYARETLFVGDSAEEAERKFVQKINESIKSSWTTNVNWAFHNNKNWR